MCSNTSLAANAYPEEIHDEASKKFALQPYWCWIKYRQAMIEHAGIALFVWNKKDKSGKIVSSAGMKEEFDLAFLQVSCPS